MSNINDFKIVALTLFPMIFRRALEENPMGVEEIGAAAKELYRCHAEDAYLGGRYKLPAHHEDAMEFGKFCHDRYHKWLRAGRPRPFLGQPRIVCAANKHRVTGRIITGARHWDELMRAQLKDETKEWDQGFVDQRGNWYTRTEAHVIAAKEEQIIRRCGGDDEVLYSENLY